MQRGIAAPASLTPSSDEDATSTSESRSTEEASDIAPPSMEKQILEIAQAAGGVVSPSDIALRSDSTLDEAKENLEALLAKGHVEMRVRKNGDLVYVVPALLSNENRADLESTM